MVLLACIVCLCVGFGLGVVAVMGVGCAAGQEDGAWGESGAGPKVGADGGPGAEPGWSPLIKLGPGGDYAVTYSGLKYSKPVPGRWARA